MDKKTFLEELRKSLRVLKEEELQDIINEYEQHIDMKVNKGLTVEQAIADFGNVKELAAEILEAYHVRAEFSMSDESETELILPKAQESDREHTGGEEESQSTVDQRSSSNSIIQKAASVVSGFCAGLVVVCKGILKKISWCLRQTKRPFLWIKTKYSGWRENWIHNKFAKQKTNREASEQERKLPFMNFAPEHKSGRIRHTLKGFGYMMIAGWNWMIGVALWCLRACWNCCVVGTAVFIGVFGLIGLYTVGVLAVLWMQGYPLAGVTIGCFGIVLCLFSCTALAWTLLWKRASEKIPESSDTDKNMTEMEESQHA